MTNGVLIRFGIICLLSSKSLLIIMEPFKILVEVFILRISKVYEISVSVFLKYKKVIYKIEQKSKTT
ncbi:hypothetical protein HERIO_2726 [Hepatospora eriocheir]|uniref:Uncharacterized protein n=1 Tax=Hepatospora eriocheir TaxID=1081669 RepID=A0A1X0Q8S9_9MICR|nr:hypothetical protein HERIO_2726 [Hepatospora eriocheir]